MTTKAVLTTGDAARHCHVSSETVANWIRSGKLKAYMTPGQHRRIHVGDFRTFLRAHDMPPFGEDYPGRRKVLVVDDDPDMDLIVTSFFSSAAISTDVGFTKCCLARFASTSWPARSRIRTFVMGTHRTFN